MNNVYENNMRFLPLLKFLDKYKKIIIFILSLILISVTYYCYIKSDFKTKS